ncbi:MAG TPA: hypothetical protein EYP10_14085, partial [Armatimonadetes bacterium]|nr:hypothetical protein [Armatimonadota bacterium]
ELTEHFYGNLLFLASAFGASLNAFIIKRAMQNVRADVVFTVNLCFIWMGFWTFTIFNHQTNQVVELISKGYLPYVLLAGAVQMSSFLFYYRCISSLPVWLVRALMLFTPLVALICGMAILGERLNAMQYLGIALVIAGASLLIVQLYHKR